MLFRNIPASLLSLVIMLACLSCAKREKEISFYFWKTSFALDSSEAGTLKENNVKTIYLRYFDIDIPEGQSDPIPVSPLRFSGSKPQTQIVPVIYIKNRTFEKLDSSAITALAADIFSLVNKINSAAAAKPTEIQFDCDWTDGTRDRYFSFIKIYRALSSSIVSATIRLHQIKYAARTGVPPVDYGVLMYYNMGKINSGSENSIYDEKTASRYVYALKSYPLRLDIALPIFSWSQQVRNGSVIKLLNKMNAGQFKNDSNFTAVGNNRFLVKHAGFHSGYYFQESDQIKTESINREELIMMVSQVNKYSNGKLRNLIFYDLDKTNTDLYEREIFKEILDHFD